MERKVEKRNLYSDEKDQEREEKEKDDMADWDEEKLQKVINSKHNNPRTTTDKVCKYFIDAVENSKYGWFWACPNGGEKCMYRHSLPPGFKLKTREQRAAEKALAENSPLARFTLEEFIESERHKLTGTLTPVTPATFEEWKKKRLDKKAAEEEAKKLKDATGRALFERGDWHVDDDSDDDDFADALTKLRLETEAARTKKEEDRLAALAGVPAEQGVFEATGPGPGEQSSSDV